MLSLPVGTLTPDGEVIVGKDGHLFLITGSNGLIGQYVREDGIETIADHWVDHFTRRFRALQRRNIQYVQLIVPEKASVLADELPFHIDPPIPLHSLLVDRLKLIPDTPYFVDLFEVFAGAVDRKQLYLKVDRHLTCRGAHRLFMTVLKQLGLPAFSLEFNHKVRSAEVDLASHFPWIGILEDDLEPSATSLPVGSDDITCVVDDRSSRHLGTRLVFRNERAPFRKRVVAFANAFFSYGKTPQQLSWWMMRWFEEYHFVWSGGMDLDYIDQVKPNIIIAQTIERFLPRTPDA